MPEIAYHWNSTSEDGVPRSLYRAAGVLYWGVEGQSLESTSTQRDGHSSEVGCSGYYSSREEPLPLCFPRIRHTQQDSATYGSSPLLTHHTKNGADSTTTKSQGWTAVHGICWCVVWSPRSVNQLSGARGCSGSQKVSGGQNLCRLDSLKWGEVHPIPKVDETLAQLAGACLLSKLDVNSGFWKIPLAPESSPLTTVITPFGRYQFNKLRFGISSAPELFQRCMSYILEGVPGVLWQINDFIALGGMQEEHDQHLEAALRSIEKAKVK